MLFLKVLQSCFVKLTSIFPFAYNRRSSVTSAKSMKKVGLIEVSCPKRMQRHELG